MVSEGPGTTRDAIDEVVRWYRRQFRVVDTAGIRRPGRVARSGAVEAVSVVVARRAMERADVAVIVVDATMGAIAQDAAIAGEAERAGCGIIIAANKWDLVKRKEPGFAREFDEGLRRKLKFADYAPVIHTSALTGERASKLLETIHQVAEVRRRRVSTGELNRLMAAVTAAHPPPRKGRRDVRILYATQIRNGAARVRVLHQRWGEVSLCLRAVSHKPPPRGLRFRGYTNSPASPAPEEVGRIRDQRPGTRGGGQKPRGGVGFQLSGVSTH